MSWGELEGVYGSEEVRERFREILTAWASGRLDVRVPGGENPVEVWNRSVEAFQTIWNLHPDGGRVLVCSHGRTTRVILSNLLGYGLTQMQLFEHENTGLNLLQTAGKRWVALSLNNTAHL
jgi:broad specificity phosphatase PhoE